MLKVGSSGSVFSHCNFLESIMCNMLIAGISLGLTKGEAEACQGLRTEARSAANPIRRN